MGREAGTPPRTLDPKWYDLLSEPRKLHEIEWRDFKAADGESQEIEEEDPESRRPVYKLTVTVSPGSVHGRTPRSGDDTSTLWTMPDDTIHTDINISRQKRLCFFESEDHRTHEDNKFYTRRKDEDFVAWSDASYDHKRFFRIVLKDALRKFMIAFNRRWPEPHQTSKNNKIGHHY